LAVELRQVPLPLPAALATHGIAQILFRQKRFYKIAQALIHITHLAGRREFVQTVSALWAFSIRMAVITVIPYILVAPRVPNWVARRRE
jgi:hypothetical protein